MRNESSDSSTNFNLNIHKYSVVIQPATAAPSRAQSREGGFQNLSKHYKNSILQESDKTRSRQMSRASRTSSTSSIVSTGSRSASLLKKDLVEHLNVERER